MATLSLVPAYAAGADPERDTGLAGRYQLESVRETGAELMLLADGRFRYALTYGSVDLSAAGVWSASGTSLKLVTDRPPPPSLTLGRMLPEIDMRSGATPEIPLSLLVRVETPALDMTWSNMQVTAEFSNGKSRSGTTANNGFLGFVARTDSEWKGAVVRRITVAYPKGKVAAVMFPIDAKTTKTVLVTFEPGAMVPQAFDSLELAVRKDGQRVVALIEKAQPLGRGWLYRRTP